VEIAVASPEEASVEALIDQIYEAALDPGSWPVVLKALSEMLGGVGCALSVEHPTDSKEGMIFAHDQDPDAARLYREYYFRVDPWLPSFLPAPGYSRFGPLSESEMIRTEIFNDWMHPQGLLPDPGLVTTLHLASDAGDFSGLNLYGRRGGRSPGGTARKLCGLLAPHLRHAVSVTRLATALQTERRRSQDMFDRLPVAAALVNARGRVVWLNEPCRRLVAEADGIAIGRDGFEAALPAETRQLRRSIAGALQTAQDASSTAGDVIFLSRPSGRRSLSALVFPIPPGAKQGFDSDPCVGVFVSDPERRVELPVDTLRRLYGLTPAEARLTVLLASGTRLQAAADELGIRINTARHHLKQVFTKTRTGTQSALIHLLLTSGLFFSDPDPGELRGRC
jgi:DNA-binding CsgD family transcriptional regulator